MGDPSDREYRKEALVLVFVYRSGWRRYSPRSLDRIAATADALNRDYLTEPDFMAAVEGLAAHGLIKVAPQDKLALTQAGRSLIRETKQKSWYQQVQDIAGRLAAAPRGAVQRGLLPEGAYTRAIDQYLARHR